MVQNQNQNQEQNQVKKNVRYRVKNDILFQSRTRILINLHNLKAYLIKRVTRNEPISRIERSLFLGMTGKATYTLAIGTQRHQKH